MDNQRDIQYCQCVVCGDECRIVSNGDDSSTRLENRRLFSIFLGCVSTNNGEIDSSIVSDLDSVVNCNRDDGLVFCSTCKSALIEWDKLYETLLLISQKLNRIKFMFYAKILNNSMPDKIDAHAGKYIADQDGVNDRRSLFLVRKIQHVKDEICRRKCMSPLSVQELIFEWGTDL